MPPVESYEPFAWLQGGPHLEVGFLTELKTSHGDFLADLLDVVSRTTPKAELASTVAELEQAKKDFLAGYPWDENDENSFIMHAWDALARFQFKEKRESLVKVNQISDVLMHVNFLFWGDIDDGWGQRGLKNDELPDFVDFLKGLSRLSPFLLGSIGFHTWTMFLFPTEECFPHPDYHLKNLTRSAIESRANNSAYEFIYVIARKDFLDDGKNLPEEDGYFILKVGDLLKQRSKANRARRGGV
jgi:hypothetical protein